MLFRPYTHSSQCSTGIHLELSRSLAQHSAGGFADGLMLEWGRVQVAGGLLMYDVKQGPTCSYLLSSFPGNNMQVMLSIAVLFISRQQCSTDSVTAHTQDSMPDTGR
jgi:hypothetical protein